MKKTSRISILLWSFVALFFAALLYVNSQHPSIVKPAQIMQMTPLATNIPVVITTMTAGEIQESWSQVSGFMHRVLGDDPCKTIAHTGLVLNAVDAENHGGLVENAETWPKRNQTNQMFIGAGYAGLCIVPDLVSQVFAFEPISEGLMPE